LVIGIIVTHGNLGEELIDTARTVFGDFEGCFALSNASKSSQVIIDELEGIFAGHEDSDAMIFVDFFGGGCSYACLRFQEKHGKIPIVSGVNLPILLAFLNKRDDVPFDTLAGELVKRGQDSIRTVDIDSL